MKVNFILSEIDAEVQDVASTTFIYYTTLKVPNRDDPFLSYEKGEDKKGKVIETCVLFVDIRDSVALTDKHKHQTMGRVYTAFTKAVLKVAKYHGGHVRNIIGDRVMVVFPVENCFKNAVDCSVSINHIASKIINQRFNVNFKCGIGIAYGKLRVIKVGIQRRGAEHSENKGLIWVGKPANYASRITDMANKRIEEELVEIKYHPRNPRSIRSSIFPNVGIFGSLYDPNASPFLTRIDTKTITKEEFVNKLSDFNDNSFNFSDGKLITSKKIKRIVQFPSILVSKPVMDGLKRDDPSRASLKKDLWKKIDFQFKNMGEDVFGADLIWI